MAETRTFTAVKSVRLINDSGSHYGNALGPYLSSGPFTGIQTRSEINIPLDWSGATQCTDAYLYLKVKDNSCIGGIMGASVRFFVEQLATDFPAGSATGSCTYSATNAEIWPGQAALATNRGIYTPASNPSVGDVIKVHITALMEALRAAGSGVLRLRLIACDSNGTTYDESGGSSTISFESVNGSYKPRIVVTVNTDTAPNAPTIATPAPTSGTPTTVASTTGRAVAVQWTQSDPDRGDTTSSVQIQVYPNASTDGAPGTALVDVTTALSGSPTTGTITVTIPLANARTQLRLRVRTKDKAGTWGAWTSLTNGRFQTAFTSLAPANPYFQNTTTNQPAIAGSISSADAGDYATQYEVQAYQDNVGGGSITAYAPGPQPIGGSPTRAQLAYQGIPVNAGDTLRWRHRIYGRDGVAGAWSSYMYVTFVTVTGPTGLSPTDRNTKILSLTPTITIGNVSNYDRYRIRFYRAGGLVFDSGVVTVASTATTAYVMAAGVAQWGDQLTYDCAIRITGNSALDPASPQYPIQFDTLPATTLAVSA